MNVTILPSLLKGEIDAPVSKSIAHRYLIAAAFSDAPCTISPIDLSEDITATMNVLKTIGADIHITGRSAKVIPCSSEHLQVLASRQLPLYFDVKESASTYRFFLVIASFLGLNSYFRLGKSLKKRPMEVFFRTLRDNGFLVELTEEASHIQGILPPGRYCLEDSLSSQFITGFLLGMAICSDVSRELYCPSISHSVPSKPYIDMTIAVLKEFNITIDQRDNVFFKAPDSPLKPKRPVFPTEGDWSASAFYLIAAVLQQTEIKINGLNGASIQGDRKIAGILSNFYKENADSSFTCVSKVPFKLSSLNMDVSQTPDLLPLLAVLAVFCDNESTFRNIERLRYKESNRIENVCKVLSDLNVKTKYTNNTLYVFPPSDKATLSFTREYLPSFHDHRMVMMIALLSCVTGSPITITDSEAVRKSYPNFFNDLVKLGCHIEIGE